jgi:hypothetical protein
MSPARESIEQACELDRRAAGDVLTDVDLDGFLSAQRQHEPPLGIGG